MVGVERAVVDVLGVVHLGVSHSFPEGSQFCPAR